MGSRPPARPRTNRLRQVIVAAGRREVAVADAAVAVLAGRGSVVRVACVVRRGACGCRVARGACVVLVVVGRGRGRGRPPATPRAARRAPPRHSPKSIQPPMTTIEIAATTGAARTTRSGGRTSAAPTTTAASDEDPDRVRQAHRQAEAEGVERRSRACPTR